MHLAINTKLVFIYVYIILVLIFQYFLLNKYKSSEYLEHNSEISVRIIKPPVISNESIKYYVRTDDGLNLFVKLDRNVEFRVGDVCKLSGKLVKPYLFDNFDYYKYLYSNNIYYSFRIFKYECFQDNDRGLYSIYNLKESINYNIYKRVPSPYAEFMIGILWGDNLSFDPQTSNLFILTGTTHIIAASGFNVSVIYLIFDKLLFFVNRKYRDIIIGVMLIIYALLGGFAPSITRAVLMYILKIFAYNLGIPVHAYSLFIYSAFLILLFKPYYIFNISFQLSCLATFGLIVVTKILQKTVLKNLGENFISTVSATISTLPISVLIFKQFSLMSIFVNSILLFIIDDLMLITFVGGVVSMFHDRLGTYILSLGHIISFSFLYLLEFISQFFVKLNLSIIYFK